MAKNHDDPKTNKKTALLSGLTKYYLEKMLGEFTYGVIISRRYQ